MSDIPPESISDEQARQNRTTRNQWHLYASHRLEIEKLIVPESRGQRLCVVGAGNCNDLDLRWLAGAYGEVHLVDIDPLALDGAVRRQRVAASASADGIVPTSHALGMAKIPSA